MCEVLKRDAGKDYKNQLDWSCKKRRSAAKSKGGAKCPAYSKKEGRLTGFVISCVGTALLNHVIKGHVKGRIEVAGRRGVRRKQLLNDLKETGGHWNFRGSSTSHSVGKSLWIGLWTYRKTDYGMLVVKMMMMMMMVMWDLSFC